MIVVLFALLLAVGCGGGDGDSGSTADRNQSQPSGSSTTPGREAVPDIPPAPDVAVGVALLPYLDEAGSVSEGALAANDVFTLHVFADIRGQAYVSAAQFALSLPAGISVIGETKFSPKVVTVGRVTDLFAMAFECHEPGRFLLMKFTCRVDDTFSGGNLAIRPGVDAEGTAYLGFATCGEGQAAKLPASGGAVMLTLK